MCADQRVFGHSNWMDWIAILSGFGVGAIVGVGSTRRASAVRWGVAGNIVWAWILTIPASAFVAAIAYWFSLQIF